MKAARLALATTLSFALLLGGCGSFMKEVSSEVQNQLGGSETSTSGTSAVASLNEYSDLVNAVYDEMDYLEYDLYYYEDDIQYYEPGAYELYFDCLFEVYELETMKASTASPSSELAKEDRDWLTSQAAQIVESAENTKTMCMDLDRYVSAQDYKDDNFAKSEQLLTSLYAEMDRYYELHNALVAKLDELYDIHENFVVDPNDPISVGIGNMKEDMDLADAFVDLVDAAYEKESFDGVNELQSLYDQLLASAEAHGANPGITDQYTYDYYEYFYSDLQDSFLPAAKRAIRAFNTQSWTELDSAYWDLDDYYGFMIDNYNLYLDISGY